MVRHRTRTHIRLGAVSLALGGAAFALIQILQGTIGAFEPRPVVTTLLAVSVGLAGATLARARQRSAEDRRSAELLRIWPLRRVRDTGGLALGVFPARTSNGDDGLPTYVPRDVDPLLDRALADGGCVIVVGPPRAGKTRTAFEAMRRTLGDRDVVVPADGAALTTLADDAWAGFGADAVWWLDDLERFLADMSGGDLSVLADRGLAVVATIRTEPWEAMLRAGGDEGEVGRRLRGAATVIPVAADLSPAEAARAAAEFGEHDFSGGIGERLAAGADGPVARAPVDRRPAQRTADPLLWAAGVTTLLLALALGLVIGIGGFTVATPPPLSDQVDALRQQAAARGEKVVFVHTEQLHGFDQTSYVFILRPVSQGSDELRVYDVSGGWLRLRLDFQPQTHGTRFAAGTREFAGTAYTSGVSVTGEEFSATRANRGEDDFRLEHLQVPDLFNDGNHELLADYTFTPAAHIDGPQLPLIAVWNDLAERYELRSLQPDSQAQLPGRRWSYDLPGTFVLRDPAAGRELREHAADGYIVLPETAQYPPTVVVGSAASSPSQNGLAVTQYGLFGAAGQVSLGAPVRCDTEVLLGDVLGPAVPHLLRASIGLAQQRLSVAPDASCGRY